jgi:hypothetical protein
LFAFTEALPPPAVNETENPEIDLTQGLQEPERESIPSPEEKT